MKMLSLLLTVFTLSLFGELADNVKKGRNKAEGSQIRGIDFIYVINLDKRPEKWANVLRQLQLYGVEPYRFSAVNGWEDLTLEIINDVGVQLQPWMRTDRWGT